MQRWKERLLKIGDVVTFDYPYMREHRRIGCHVALEEQVDSIICLGYPLCGAGDRTKLRDEVLRALRTPILFVQGTRDPLCPLDLLERVRREMQAPNALHLIEGGDHSLGVSKRELQTSGRTQEAIDQRILDVIAQFVEGNVAVRKEDSSGSLNPECFRG
jgi:predicted alpha/beta-hydrolase family hydrolase